MTTLTAAVPIARFEDRESMGCGLPATADDSLQLANRLGVAERDDTKALQDAVHHAGRTLLNVRIVTSEDVRELRSEKPNVLAAECWKDAHGSRVDFDDLLKASLRWKPDRTILGKVRGVEARTLLDFLLHRSREFDGDHSREQRSVDAQPVQRAGDALPSASDMRRPVR